MPLDHLPTRQIAVLASAVIYWGGVAIQARRVRRKIGHSPNVAPKGTKEILLWIGWTTVVLAWLIQPILGATPNTLPGLRLHPNFTGSIPLGLTLLTFGYAATLWCYNAMGKAWRMGIDHKEQTQLVTRGPYKFIRHPIYAFQVLMLAGSTLLLPSVLSLAILTLHLACVAFKVADEESHLAKLHGPAYLQYKKQTGRLLPRLLPPSR
ncbi:MAG: methyltransferase family protein [Limisphaerales bacterium]|jgi:protein-S-isoprenylcysteine O-methyltransferase Ste14